MRLKVTMFGVTGEGIATGSGIFVRFGPMVITACVTPTWLHRVIHRLWMTVKHGSVHAEDTRVIAGSVLALGNSCPGPETYWVLHIPATIE